MKSGRNVLEVVVDVLVGGGLGLGAMLQDGRDAGRSNQFANGESSAVAANEKTGRVMRFDSNTFDPLRPHHRMRDRSADDEVIESFLATGGKACREDHAIDEFQETGSC